MKRHKIIFVGGVHGVGKTTFCKTVALKFNIRHFSASTLISREKKEKYHQNKQVENIDKNQDTLITAINKYLNYEDWYLLDGHFCLLNKGRQITKISYSTFEDISPNAVIALFDNPENIYSRLYQRDDIKYDLASINSFQEQEINYAEYISEKLNIPHLICSATNDTKEIDLFLEDSMARGI